MNYIKFHRLLGAHTVFSILDIKKLDPLFHRRRLNEWQKKGYIKKLVKGYYIFSDLAITDSTLFEIANRIYPPSYISFETALSYYGLIPESAYGLISASTRRTYRFKTPIAEFFYRTVTPRLFFGYEIVSYGSKVFKIASAEKALLDYLYLNPHIKDDRDFESLRLKKDIFTEKLDKGKLDLFLRRFGYKMLAERLNALRGFIKNA